MLHTIVARLSRGRSFKRRLPRRFGHTPLYVSPDAQLKHLKPGRRGFDAELLRTVDEHIDEHSVVWDIGANVGVFSFAAASIATKGSALAVEADIWLAHMMRRSVRLKENRGLNLHVLPCAISDKNGVASFLIAGGERGQNALESVGFRSPSVEIRQRCTVPTLSLDTLLEFFDPPTFLKIDVEGAEAHVLCGARMLLREIRPTIYVEVGEEHDAAVTALLTENDYALFDGATPLQEQEQACGCAFNTLAVPQ